MMAKEMHNQRSRTHTSYFCERSDERPLVMARSVGVAMGKGQPTLSQNVLDTKALLFAR